MTGLNGRAGRAYLENEPRFVCAIDPRGIRLVAGLRQGFDAPDNPSRTQRPTDPTRVHTGIVGRTSTNERWQAEDCGRQMTDKHPKRPRDLKGPCGVCAIIRRRWLARHPRWTFHFTPTLGVL